MRNSFLTGIAMMMAIGLLSCSSAPNDLVKIVQDSDNVLVEEMAEPIMIWEQYQDTYPAELVTANIYFSYSYFVCTKGEETLYYDWSGRCLPFDNKEAWPDSIRKSLCFHTFMGCDMQYLNGDAIRDCNLQVVIPDPTYCLWQVDSCWVFVPGEFRTRDHLYDLDGKRIWQSSDGWEIKNLGECDGEHLTLLLSRTGEGAENPEETTVEIPVPVTPQQSRYCYNLKEGFHFLPPELDIQDIYLSPGVVDLGLSVKWTFNNYDKTIPNVLFYDEEYSTKYKCYEDSYKKIGDNFRLPTKEEMDELLAECVWTRLSMPIDCYLVTSKKNGCSMLMPVASARYWTSTMKNGKHIPSAANEFNDVVLELMYETDDDENTKVYCLSLEGDKPQIVVAELNDSLAIRLVTDPIAGK